MSKLCSSCGKTKALSQYHKRRNGVQSICKECKSKADFARNANSDKKREQKKERYKRISTWIDDYKSNIGCVYCKEKDPLFLDFHHKDESKEFSIGSRKNYSEDRIKAEIEKCYVVCCKCHRMIHANRIDELNRMYFGDEFDNLCSEPSWQ